MGVPLRHERRRRHPSIPIVAFSREDTLVQAERTYNLGANAFALRLDADDAWHDVMRGLLTFWLSPLLRLLKPFQ